MNTSSSPDELGLSIERTPTGAVVHCTGRITAETVESLRTTVKPLLSPGERVALDLANVSYMDSAGLGALVGFYTSAQAASCQFKLINLEQRIKQLLSITQLLELRWLGS
jgi:anti-sigma B factor antagonist